MTDILHNIHLQTDSRPTPNRSGVLAVYRVNNLVFFRFVVGLVVLDWGINFETFNQSHQALRSRLGVASLIAESLMEEDKPIRS